MMPTFACAPRNTAPPTIAPGARVHARTGMVRR